MNETRTGLIELDHRNRGGILRSLSLDLEKQPGDVRLAPDLLHRWNLREGTLLEHRLQRGPMLRDIRDVVTINGLAPEEWRTKEEFNRRTAIDPHERIRLTTTATDISMRVIDLVCPIGKGQRALIVSPPKSGKTMLMQQLAHAISTNHEEIHLIVLLIDERPEEVTDMRRTVRGQVFASSSDSDRENHVRLARLVLEYAKRKVEAGKDVVLLLDSLTRMGRAFNLVQRSSGRTLSGGVDARAMDIPKKIFGAARALEGEGSLTIIATALIETNSRMDEVIFEEFKGTGNMELVLNRDLANERIFPAIDILKSGTRREELLFKSETPKYQQLRRLLNKQNPKDAMLALQQAIEAYPTNRKLVARMTGSIEVEG